MDSPIKQYLRIDEVAIILKVSKKTVRRYIHEGRIKAIFLNQGNKGIRITVESVAIYQQELENGSKT